MLITAVFAEYLIWIAILGATLFVFNVYLMYRIVTTLLNQKSTINQYTKNLESVIKTSSETSINVSNSATQLAASASEVNSTSEEISATTMEVNLKAHSQTKSLADINEMAQEIKIISDVIIREADCCANQKPQKCCDNLTHHDCFSNAISFNCFAYLQRRG